MTATDQDQEIQTAGTITYDLGLSAVIDLDHDPVFANLSAAGKQRVLRRLTAVMAEAGREFFAEFAEYHQITMPEGGDPQDELLDALAGLLSAATAVGVDEEEE